MKDLNKKPTFSRSNRPPSSEKKIGGDFHKINKENKNTLVWKQNNSTTNIRMMTTRQGVSERVIHEQPCKILDKCGSCPSLDLPYKNQLQQKTADFKSRLTSAGEEFSKSIVKDCIESEEKFGYRHHIKMVVSEHVSINSSGFSNIANPKRWIDLGIYNQSSNEVVDTGRCPIQTNVMNDISAYIRTGIRVHNISVYTPKQKNGLLHCVTLRSSHFTRQAQVTFIVTKPDLNLFKPFARDISEKFMNIQGVFLQVASPNQNEDLSQNQELILLAGQNLIEEKYNDLLFKYSASSFMPPNSLIANRIYNRIEELAELTGKETFLDLYCGAGGVSLSLARSSSEVIAIDPSSIAIKDANRNAKLNHISNAGFYEGNINTVIQKLKDDKRIQNVDIVFINPPKNGCEDHTIELIKSLNPRAVLYLSSFNSMFKDLKSFAQHGYNSIIFEPYDTFPGTNKYEVLCYLVKN